MLGYLQFSDAAKFADIARNIISGLGYNGKFSFWSSGIIDLSQRLAFPSPWTPPLMPLSIAASFQVFGINDFAVLATSFLYFILTLIFVYLLAKRVFKNNLVAILSTIAVGFNFDLITYATNGASESLFIFEIVIGVYLISLRKKWSTVLGFIFMVLLYFTRSQAFIYIAGTLLYWALTRFKRKKALYIFSLILVVGFLIDYFVLPRLAGKYFLYSVFGRGFGTLTQVSSGGSASDSLRGVTVQADGVITIIKKLFYNLYNFYKLAPQIINPYLLTLFVIGLFKWGKDRFNDSFRATTTFMVIITFLVAALSIPFFRYIHPIVPFVYIIGVGTLVELISNFQFPISIPKQKFIILVSTFLILVFGVGQTLGIMFLDSRFKRNTHNVGKPPVYVGLSRIMKENTDPSDFIITNLDTWGSWYGERRTIWFPGDPKQLVNSKDGKIPFDAIYLTSYLIDDQNYFMGNPWRQIFENPSDPKRWTCDGCREIAKEFKLKGVYTISPGEDYERDGAKAVLLIKK